MNIYGSLHNISKTTILVTTFATYMVVGRLARKATVRRVEDKKTTAEPINDSHAATARGGNVDAVEGWVSEGPDVTSPHDTRTGGSKCDLRFKRHLPKVTFDPDDSAFEGQ